ncbi:MAG: hypothetical protein RKP46_11610 [Candidatus Accumulibacter sp.]|uniref:hypothetical protein n=1 Tax=Accumulibacter sp. TaxID=2053492 RepID=UPI0028793B04|nr:hypothetical protein [Accumulibacter sp.]MDS4014981.1 hypothetical protein [Accumulibacter sp.]
MAARKSNTRRAAGSGAPETVDADVAGVPAAPASASGRRAGLALVAAGRAGRFELQFLNFPGERHHGQPVTEVLERADIAQEIEPATLVQRNFREALGVNAELVRAI